MTTEIKLEIVKLKLAGKILKKAGVNSVIKTKIKDKIAELKGK